MIFQERWFRGTAFFIAGAVLVFNYSNCSSRIFSSTTTASAPHWAISVSNDPEVQIQMKLADYYKNRLDSDVCNIANRFLCDRRVYSPDVVSAIGPAQHPCVALTVESGSSTLILCPEGNLIEINTSYRSDYCRDHTDSCGNATSEFDEYVCYFALPNEEGKYPLHAASSSLKSSLEMVHEACIGVVQKSQAL